MSGLQSTLLCLASLYPVNIVSRSSLSSHRQVIFVLEPHVDPFHIRVYTRARERKRKRAKGRENRKRTPRNKDQEPNLGNRSGKGSSSRGGNSNSVRGGFTGTGLWMDLFKGVYSAGDTMAKRHRGEGGQEERRSCIGVVPVPGGL